MLSTHKGPVSACATLPQIFIVCGGAALTDNSVRLDTPEAGLAAGSEQNAGGCNLPPAMERFSIFVSWNLAFCLLHASVQCCAGSAGEGWHLVVDSCSLPDTYSDVQGGCAHKRDKSFAKSLAHPACWFGVHHHRFDRFGFAIRACSMSMQPQRVTGRSCNTGSRCTK